MSRFTAQASPNLMPWRMPFSLRGYADVLAMAVVEHHVREALVTPPERGSGEIAKRTAKGEA